MVELIICECRSVTQPCRHRAVEIKNYFCKNISPAQGGISCRLEGEHISWWELCEQIPAGISWWHSQAQAKIRVQLGTYPKGKHTQSQQRGTLIRVITYKNNIKGRAGGREWALCIIQPWNSNTEKNEAYSRLHNWESCGWVLENACLA